MKSNFCEWLIVLSILLSMNGTMTEEFDSEIDRGIELNGAKSLFSEKVLSRKRRYVAFPEGSSFSCALCTTIGVIGNPNYQFLSYALNWGVAYDLPNETWIRHHANGFQNSETPKPVVQRRFRRDLYNKIEIAIDSMGYSGRDCILRALCEVSRKFTQKGRNMIEEMIRTVFNFPKNRILSSEHMDTKIYAAARRTKRDTRDCSEYSLKCSFSLLELALGKYNAPSSSSYF